MWKIKLKHHLTTRITTVAIAALLTFNPAFAVAQEAPIVSVMDRFTPIRAEHGMVSSQNAQSSQVGIDILKAGGNAVDAAIAVGFSLAVTLPKAGNLGGGGFMLFFDKDDNAPHSINFRDEAPSAAFQNMHLDAEGEVDKDKTRGNGLSVAVPGTVAGLAKAYEEFGSGNLTWAELIAPAIRQAEHGFLVNNDMHVAFSTLKNRLARDPEGIAIFYGPDDTVPRVGDLVVQSDLANSLRIIAEEGRDGFYKGIIAQSIVDTASNADGILPLDDFANYEARLGEPIRGTYRGYDILSMDPPSSGGVHIVQMLNMLENADMQSKGLNSAAYTHLLAETMRRAYADRSSYLGDPAFTDVPVAGITSKAYAKELFDDISLTQATASSDIGPGNPLPYESDETTHYSVTDKDGNAVAVTYTLGFSFGNGLVADGTGILLNNTMGGFSAKPGTPNAFGLLGGQANAIEAGKRPLSSMTPTIIVKDGEPFLVTGSPGGSRIITATLQVILNAIDHGLNIAEATNAIRIHHQWYPDEIRTERGFPIDTKRILEGMGHEVVIKNAMGSTQSIMRVGNEWQGASDPRRDGAKTIGY